MSRLVANRSTEKDLRDHLSRIGHLGETARFHRLELVALERPGWVQVFDFHVESTDADGDRAERFGICRTDERRGLFEVELYLSKFDQLSALGRNSEGMITQRSREERISESHWLKSTLMVLFLVASVIAGFGLALNPPVDGDATATTTDVDEAPKKSLGGDRAITR